MLKIHNRCFSSSDDSKGTVHTDLWSYDLKGNVWTKVWFYIVSMGAELCSKYSCGVI